MIRFHRIVTSALVLLFSSVASAETDDATQIEFFERKIRPVLVEKCYPCHSGTPDKVEGKLWLDSKAGWTKGGQSGPSIVPGNPEASLLLHAIRGTEKDLSMPPDEKLPEAVIADFERWIREGAVDPRRVEEGQNLASRSQSLTEREKWVYSKPVKPEPPSVKNHSWTRNPIDQFILAKLEAASLTPSNAASAEQLVRRLHFDLTGLPPTPSEVDAFVQAFAENPQGAVEALVDDLLARPSYGEKWGRFWLDCVRYADSLDARAANGGDIVDAWRYRDWVVNAFNSDLPYNEFIRQQIAGDILAQQLHQQQKQWNPELLVATGVYAIGNWGNGDSDKKKVHTDIVDDQIDVTSRVFLGLTLSCARCHDHKFDPLTTADYYSLAGFFFSSRILEKFADPTAGESLMRIDLLSPEEQERRNQLQAQIADIDRQLNQKLIPLTRRIDNVAGLPGLVSWAPDESDQPSLVINSGEAPQMFATVNLPGRAICIHPSPQIPATIVWKSPVAGEVEIVAQLEDIDPSCGDGISWTLSHADRALARGEIGNGSPPMQIVSSCNVEAGQLIRLAVFPQQNHFCDSTRVELTVEHLESGRIWNLTQSLLTSVSPIPTEESPFVVCSGDGILLPGESTDHTELKARIDELKAQLPQEIKCQGLLDGGIPGTAYEGFHDAPIHVRGSYNRLAAVQPRGFPAVFNEQIPEFQGSGRLALADWIASADNPLTARVIVNRLWQHHFGRGIVATPNNFGKLGTPPTHPELLDWLAVTLVEKGWSLKSIHRLICTSATYQQSSLSSPKTLKLDPDNQLFSRQQRRKLTAEELRDATLAVTGELDLTRGGPAVTQIDVPRRTLYLKTVRSDRTSYQLLFDGADPTSIVEQRNESLVAPQALWLLNHPFILARAEKLAENVLKSSGESREDRLRSLNQLLFSRKSNSDLLSPVSKFLSEQDDSIPAWQTVCHVLLCSNEFLFID